MTGRRLYLICIASYLTGWPIAQAVYNRVIKHIRETAWIDEKADIARRVADELERRKALR